MTVATKPLDDGEKKVCRRVTTIGSNIPGKKVCVTRGEYEAARIKDMFLKQAADKSAMIAKTGRALMV